MNGVRGDHGGQRLVADAQSDLREQAVDADFLDKAGSRLRALESGQRVVGIGRRAARALPAGWLCAVRQSISASEMR